METEVKLPPLKKLTLEDCRQYLAEFDGGVLYAGVHASDEPKFCVRELRAVMLGQRKNDHPDGHGVASATDLICQRLNDAHRDDQLRTEVCLPLTLLCEAEASAGWLERYTEKITRLVLPHLLEATADAADDGEQAVKLRELAERCRSDERLTTLGSIRDDLSSFVADMVSPYGNFFSMMSAALSVASNFSYAAVSYGRKDQASYLLSGISTACISLRDVHSLDANPMLATAVKLLIECQTEAPCSPPSTTS